MGSRDTSNLLSLQNLMKRDPQSYEDEFNQQLRHFDSSYQIFVTQGALPTHVDGSSDASSKPISKPSKDFASLITFLAHVCPCFKERKECEEFPRQLRRLLEDHAEKLDTTLRRTIVQSLIMLQNRGMQQRDELLKLLFKLFGTPDKALRVLLFSHIVNDIRHLNRNKTNKNKAQSHKVNQSLQNFMFEMLKNDNVTAAKKSLDVMIELWRRKVWVDAKSVNAIATACFSKDAKIMTQALRFFLGIEQVEKDNINGEDEDDKKDVSKSVAMKALMIASSGIKGVKRKGKRQREMKRAVARIRSADGDGKNGHSSVSTDYPAIQLLHDPQQFAEKLFSMLKRSGEAFTIRQLMMNVISRLIGGHKLLVLDFYPFLQKYIQAHQRDVTSILVFLAQASHDLVPPDVIRPCVKTLANSFVTDRSSPELMAVGINAIREVCARAPLVMNRELLHDLAQYKRSKFKGVMMASRSVIALFRDINPSLLLKRDRGKSAAIAVQVRPGQTEPVYGGERVFTDVPGAELLQAADLEAAERGEVNTEDPWAPPKVEKKKRKKKGDASSDEDEDSDDDNDDDRDYPEITLSDSDDDKEEDGEQPLDEDDDKSIAGDAEGDDAEGDADSDDDENVVIEMDGEGDEFITMDGEGDDSDDDESTGFIGLTETTPKKGGKAAATPKGKAGKSTPKSSLKGSKKGSNSSKDESDSKRAAAPAAAAAGDSKEEAAKVGWGGGWDAATGALPVEKKLPYAATKFFTPRDIEKIQALRLQSELTGGAGVNAAGKKKRKRFDGTAPDRVTKAQDAPLDETDIIGYVPKSRQDKASRLLSVTNGRQEERDFRKEGKEKKGGSTNQEKIRNKAFMMTKHGAARAKSFKSFNDNQKAKGAHIKKLKMLAVGKRNKKRRKG